MTNILTRVRRPRRQGDAHGRTSSCGLSLSSSLFACLVLGLCFQELLFNGPLGTVVGSISEPKLLAKLATGDSEVAGRVLSDNEPRLDDQLMSEAGLATQTGPSEHPSSSFPPFTTHDPGLSSQQARLHSKEHDPNNLNQNPPSGWSDFEADYDEIISQSVGFPEEYRRALNDLCKEAKRLTLIRLDDIAKNRFVDSAHSVGGIESIGDLGVRLGSMQMLEHNTGNVEPLNKMVRDLPVASLSDLILRCLVQIEHERQTRWGIVPDWSKFPITKDQEALRKAKSLVYRFVLVLNKISLFKKDDIFRHDKIKELALQQVAIHMVENSNEYMNLVGRSMLDLVFNGRSIRSSHPWLTEVLPQETEGLEWQIINDASEFLAQKNSGGFLADSYEIFKGIRPPRSSNVADPNSPDHPKRVVELLKRLVRVETDHRGINLPSNRDFQECLLRHHMLNVLVTSYLDHAEFRQYHEFANDEEAVLAHGRATGILQRFGDALESGKALQRLLDETEDLKSRFVPNPDPDDEHHLPWKAIGDFDLAKRTWPGSVSIEGFISMASALLIRSEHVSKLLTALIEAILIPKQLGKTDLGLLGDMYLSELADIRRRLASAPEEKAALQKWYSRKMVGPAPLKPSFGQYVAREGKRQRRTDDPGDETGTNWSSGEMPGPASPERSSGVDINTKDNKRQKTADASGDRTGPNWLKEGVASSNVNIDKKRPRTTDESDSDESEDEMDTNWLKKEMLGPAPHKRPRTTDESGDEMDTNWSKERRPGPAALEPPIRVYLDKKGHQHPRTTDGPSTKVNSIPPVQQVKPSSVLQDQIGTWPSTMRRLEDQHQYEQRKTWQKAASEADSHLFSTIRHRSVFDWIEEALDKYQRDNLRQLRLSSSGRLGLKVFPPWIRIMDRKGLRFHYPPLDNWDFQRNRIWCEREIATTGKSLFRQTMIRVDPVTGDRQRVYSVIQLDASDGDWKDGELRQLPTQAQELEIFHKFHYLSERRAKFLLELRQSLKNKQLVLLGKSDHGFLNSALNQVSDAIEKNCASVFSDWYLYEWADRGLIVKGASM